MMRLFILAVVCATTCSISWAEHPQVTRPAAPIKLEYGKSLTSFSPTINLARQVEKISLVGFEPPAVEYRSGDTSTPVRKYAGVRKQPRVYLKRK